MARVRCIYILLLVVPTCVKAVNLHVVLRPLPLTGLDASADGAGV